MRQRSEVEYDVWMRNDSNGTGALQWFYFRIRNPQSFTGFIKLNIVNFTKGNSLFFSVS